MKEPAVTRSGLELDGLKWHLAISLVFAAENAKEGVGASEEMGLAVNAEVLGRVGDGVREARETGKRRVVRIVGRDVGLIAK